MKKVRVIPLIVGGLLLTPCLVLAQGTVNYVSIINIPGVSNTSDLNALLNALYALSISIAALLAVIKIVIAGVKYMLTDVVTSKQAAREDIQGAVFGLLIVVAAVLILLVINPDIVS